MRLESAKWTQSGQRSGRYRQLRFMTRHDFAEHRMPTHTPKMLAILATLPRLPMPSAVNLATFERRAIALGSLTEAFGRHSPKRTADQLRAIAHAPVKPQGGQRSTCKAARYELVACRRTDN